MKDETDEGVFGFFFKEAKMPKEKVVRMNKMKRIKKGKSLKVLD